MRPGRGNSLWMESKCYKCDQQSHLRPSLHGTRLQQHQLREAPNSQTVAAHAYTWVCARNGYPHTGVFWLLLFFQRPLIMLCTCMRGGPERCTDALSASQPTLLFISSPPLMYSSSPLMYFPFLPSYPACSERQLLCLAN